MTFSQTSQFKKDVKRQKKRGKDPGKLKAAVEILVAGKPLPREYRTTRFWAGGLDVATVTSNQIGS